MSGAVPSLVQTADRCGNSSREDDDRGMKGMKGSGACSGVVSGCGGVWVVVRWWWLGCFLGVKLGEKCIFLRKSVFLGLTSRLELGILILHRAP